MTSESDPSEGAAPWFGINGVHAAYARWVAWITGDLPRQWDEMQALMGLLVSGAPAPPPYVPPPYVPPAAPLDPALVYTMANLLRDSDRIRADGFMFNWKARWASGYRGEDVPLEMLDGSINAWSVAMQQIGWEAVIVDGRALVYPIGEGSNYYPGAIIWHPGDAYRSGSFIPGGATVSEFLRAPEWLKAIIRLVWPEGTWEKAAGIARVESGYDQMAHNTSGEDSRGIWQINVAPGANPDLLDLGDLFDPFVNAQAAVIVWQRLGWQAWYNSCLGLGYPTSGPGVL